jgi:RNA polymerase subunit RPABC4/transcription elongation factor Spt4
MGTDTAAVDVLIGLMFLVFILGLYVIPWIVAALRKAPHVGVVAVINVFLGWTLIGWFVALALAFRSRPPNVQADSETAKTPNADAITASALLYRECPHCEQPMPREARACPHCQRDSPPWSKEGDRWWQLHDGPPHYWDEQAQQWREPPLPAGPQPAGGGPTVSHGSPEPVEQTRGTHAVPVATEDPVAPVVFDAKCHRCGYWLNSRMTACPGCGADLST